MVMITQEEYLKLREQTRLENIQFLRSQCEAVTDENPEVSVPDNLDIKLTCDNCPARFECEFATDLYNTNGDCLAEK